MSELPNWPTGWRFAADAEPVAARGGMVVTTDRYASDVGADMLRRGGNAVDAAVAVSFALAVVNPEAGNIGGGGFLIVRTADGEEAALDYRSVAPGAAGRDMLLDDSGNPSERSVIGALSAAVPGSVLGMWEAHRRFGSLPWAALVEPAVELARGFVLTGRFLHSLPDDVVEGLRRFPESARIFLPSGERPRVGETLRQEDLAETLERIRDHGPDGFYRGETADRIAAAMERSGGIMTRDDLATYSVVWREPVRIRYRGHTVVSMPPPSSGGIALAEIANMLEDVPLGSLEWNGTEHVHLLVEAWRRAYADRNHYLTDPDFADLPTDVLVSPEYGRWRAGDISPEAATPSSAVAPGVEAFLEGRAPGPGPLGASAAARESSETTHFSAVDRQGNAVSVTTTINTWYGSKMVVEGTGILLNNEMDDFSVKPGVPNYFGLVQGEANVVEPGKRPLSAMTPTIVLDPAGRVLLVVGTPGGATIITTVFQIVSNVVDHGMSLARAVAAPRVHHQHLPDRIEFEPDGLPGDVVRALERLGHTVMERTELSGDAQAILVGPGGTLQGSSDPRRGGTARGV